MATAGNITAVLTLNSSGFTSGLSSSTTALDKFKNSIISFNTDTSKIERGLESLRQHLNSVRDAIILLNDTTKNAQTFNQIANGVDKLARGLKTLGGDLGNTKQAMSLMAQAFTTFKNAMDGVEVKISGLDSALKRIASSQNGVKSSLSSLKSSFDSSYMSAEKYGMSLRNAYLEEQRQKQNLEMLSREFNQLARAIQQSISPTEQVATATKQYEQALTVTLPKQREMIMNATGVANAEMREAQASGQVAMAEEKQSVATDKATNSMNRQTTATNRLGKAMSSLKMIGTMVASMMVWNFASNLVKATRETVNAKSEMNGYFEMLGYTSGEVEHFNSKLDEMIQKFPRINKYALGETISSIGVEFELTTQEMEKAMPVVSMITSEYLRAGRNVNEASLAVKDILQGEFQRLSRETGVKGDQLKEAGWSGDKTDVMGLLEALDKVGKQRNWDVFVAKANSLNDAVMILQNRFGEWSADMVERVQPAIVGAFNSIMSIAQLFADVIGGVADWLGGEGLGQDIVKWGGLATAIGVAYVSLVHYRTGANLVQIAQMGLTKSIGASILGLEAEATAEYGLRTAMISRLTGIEAETVANEGRLASILAVASGLEAEEVATIGKTKVLFASLLGLDTAILKEEGFAVALAHATTQIEAQELASMGLIKQIALIGATTIPAIAVVGAFAVAFGNLVMKTMEATDKMSAFYDIQKNGEQYVKDSKDTIQNLKDHIDELTETQKKYGKGTQEYKNVGKAIDDLNGKIELATQNAKDNYEALQIVNSAQENYDTRKQELQLDLQQKINQSLVDTGLSVEEANELSNNYLNDAIDGSEQLYRALQSVAEQYEKEADGVASLTQYWQDKGLTPEEIKIKLDPYIDSSNAIAKDIEKMKLSTDIVEVGATWGKLQIDQWDHSWDENLPKIEAGDWIGGLTGLGKGLAHFFADLPIFHDFWGWVFENSGAKDKYAGKGSEGLMQFFSDSLWQITNFISSNFDSLIVNPLIASIPDPMPILAQWLSDTFIGIQDYIMDCWNNFISFKWLSVEGFDLGALIDNLFSGGEDSGGESTGKSSPALAKKIDFSWIPKEIIDSIVNGFNTYVANINIVSIISNLIPSDVSGIYQWVNDNIITPLVDGIKVGVLNTPVLGSVANLLGFGDDAESEASEKGQSVGSGFTTGVQTGIDPLDDVINSALSGLNLDGITSQFNTNAQSITTTASSTATNVSTSFSNMKNNQKTSLDSMALKNKTAFDDMKSKTSGTLLNMRDTTSQITSHVGKSFGTMKDNILSASNKLKTGSTNDFNALGSVIRSFYLNIQNPASWSASNNASRVAKNFGSAGIPSRTSPARKPLAGHKAVRRIGGKHGAGINPYTDSSSKTMSIRDLMSMVNVDEKVPIDKFLAMFSGGFGSWDFSGNHRSYIKNQSYNWDTAPASIQRIGQVGHGYKVDRWKTGRATFTWDDFLATAQDVFSAIPYKFYYDSEWKGNWVNALLSGAVNCSDGADALIALARVFGFDGYKQHTTLKSGVGHFFAVIGGKKMDTTNFQNHGSWSPLGGAGIPTRTASHIGRAGETQGKTVNITVSMDNAVIYGVDDLDSRIQDSVQKGIQSEFNDPYTIAI